MLDRNSLSQLSALKQQLHDAVDRAEGTIKGTQGRFGFVTLDDGREVFLPPEQMLRVFPDDRVQVKVVPPPAPAQTAAEGGKSPKSGKKARPHAELEKLLSSPLKEFTGRYAIKGNAHFVIPDLPQLSRWLFLPPKARGNAQPGDFVVARIRRHPFQDGKPQAEISARLGTAQDAGIEADYAAAHWRLPSREAALDSAPAPLLDDRLDLTGLPLVTIDAADTEDMDDALYAQSTASGWTLWVAIADPLPWLDGNPKLDRIARERASSIYLPGQVRHMLPTPLACDAGSLQPGQLRPALVCELEIASDGQCHSHRWHIAMVRCQARIDYLTLSEQLANGSASADLAVLAELSAALRQRRLQTGLVMPDRPDYELQLDSNGRLAGIVRREKNAAQGIVEECMIATNQCAAISLRDRPAIHVTHAGFRPERLGDVRALVQQELPDLAAVDPASLEGYVAIMRAAASADSSRPLRAVLSRWLERGRLSREPAPHYGMGLERYTTVTSPLRKYNDLAMHRLLAATLLAENGSAAGAALPDQTGLDAIQSVWDRARRARQLAEQWLKADWLSALHASDPSREWQAEIYQINSRGVGVRLLDNGIEGQLDLGRLGRKFRFDAKVLEMDGGEQRLQLEQRLTVAIGAIDTERHTISFAATNPLENQ